MFMQRCYLNLKKLEISLKVCKLEIRSEQFYSKRKKKINFSSDNS